MELREKIKNEIYFNKYLLSAYYTPSTTPDLDEKEGDTFAFNSLL